MAVLMAAAGIVYGAEEPQAGRDAASVSRSATGARPDRGGGATGASPTCTVDPRHAALLQSGSCPIRKGA